MGGRLSLAKSEIWGQGLNYAVLAQKVLNKNMSRPNRQDTAFYLIKLKGSGRGALEDVEETRGSNPLSVRQMV